MLKALTLTAFLLVAASPAIAAVDRDTAVKTLASLFNSTDVCQLSISRDKVNAYRADNTPAGDTAFNIDVFRATDDLYRQQKTWTKDQTDAYCKTAAGTAKTLGMLL